MAEEKQANTTEIKKEDIVQENTIETGEKKALKNVTDIISLDYLQKIQDSLGNIVGITTALLDPQGVPLSQPTNIKAFCAMMQASDTGVLMCIKANGSLIEQNIKTRGPAVITCPNSGLQTASVPIFFDDQYLGSWLIGQIRMSDVDETLIEKTSQKAGLSAEVAKENMNSLPVISPHEFNNILDFLVTITAALTDIVAVNATLDKRNSDLQLLADQLDVSLKAFQDFIDFADLGAYLVDYDTGQIIMSNKVYRDMFKVGSEKDVADTHCFTLMGYDTFCDFCPKEKLLGESGEPAEPVTWEHYNAVANIWLSITSRALRWVDGRLTIMTTFYDITDRKREEERVAYLAYNDQRLDVPNGVKLYEDLSSRLLQANDTYLICFDVQGLSKINDVYGYDAGDLLLKSVAEWVTSLPEEDFALYCVEGDDFAVMASGYSRERIMDYATRVYERFDQPWSSEINGIMQNMYTGVHMGVFRVAKELESQSALLTTIQRVLALARREKTLVYFDKKMDAELERQIQFEIELKSCALNNMEGFSLNYQPIVNSVTGDWVGLEALCRWSGPQSGFVGPDVFIEVIERLGLINLLTDWVLEEAIGRTKKWGLDAIEGFILDVNLSPVQLRDPELLDRVISILDAHDFPHKCLSLEITETAEVHFDEITVKVLGDIQAAGISMALDDFGTGYASFSNLNKLPINSLKIDRSFVINIGQDAFLQQTIKSMIALAKAAKLETVTEGVETEEEWQFMRDNGVDMIQGYYFSRPLPAEEIEKARDKFENTRP